MPSSQLITVASITANPPQCAVRDLQIQKHCVAEATCLIMLSLTAPGSVRDMPDESSVMMPDSVRGLHISVLDSPGCLSHLALMLCGPLLLSRQHLAGIGHVRLRLAQRCTDGRQAPNTHLRACSQLQMWGRGVKQGVSRRGVKEG